LFSKKICAIQFGTNAQYTLFGPTLKVTCVSPL
jgi:hypothetical protein